MRGVVLSMRYALQMQGHQRDLEVVGVVEKCRQVEQASARMIQV